MDKGLPFSRTLRLVLLAVLISPHWAWAQQVQENTLKAAFVYNFILFTEWSPPLADSQGQVVVCLNAESEMRSALEALDGKNVRNRRLSVRVLDSAEKALNQCHVLFVDWRDRQAWIGVRQRLEGSGMLVVTDDAEIGHDGATIALHRQGSKMSFDIDQTAARRSGLILSSKLLRLARMVR